MTNNDTKNDEFKAAHNFLLYVMQS